MLYSFFIVRLVIRDHFLGTLSGFFLVGNPGRQSNLGCRDRNSARNLLDHTDTLLFKIFNMVLGLTNTFSSFNKFEWGFILCLLLVTANKEIQKDVLRRFNIHFRIDLIKKMIPLSVRFHSSLLRLARSDIFSTNLVMQWYFKYFWLLLDPILERWIATKKRIDKITKTEISFKHSTVFIFLKSVQAAPICSISIQTISYQLDVDKERVCWLTSTFVDKTHS